MRSVVRVTDIVSVLPAGTYTHCNRDRYTEVVVVVSDLQQEHISTGGYSSEGSSSAYCIPVANPSLR